MVIEIEGIKKIIDNCASIAVDSEKIIDLPHAEEPYYKFLFLLARNFSFSDVIELGVYQGTGIAHLQAGYTDVVTGVDIDLSHVDDKVIHNTNIEFIRQDSASYLKTLDDKSIRFGLFHVDTMHEKEQVKKELAQIFRVAEMAIICIDDIKINPEMKSLWKTAINNQVVKFELNQLHVTGYGVLFYRKG